MFRFIYRNNEHINNVRGLSSKAAPTDVGYTLQFLITYAVQPAAFGMDTVSISV